MKYTQLRTFGLSCIYFLMMAFSATASAVEVGQAESGVTVEGWSAVGSRNLPILSFEGTQMQDDLHQDIRVENVTVDKDGSTRFQLTHNGPLSRQVFAHVRRVEQGDGFTRSIITNVADGSQMEYLTRTVDAPIRGKSGKTGDVRFSTDMAVGGDQDTECPWCWVFGTLITETSCTLATTLGAYQCRLNCESSGGVRLYDSGVCGIYDAHCFCWDEEEEVFGGAF